MRSLELRFVVAFTLMLGMLPPCHAQQAGPATLGNLLAPQEVHHPPAAVDSQQSDADPARPAGTLARPRDGVQHPGLDKAWGEYRAAVARAAEGIEAAIAKQFDAATAKGDLDAAETWQAVGEKFKKEGALPTEGQVKAAVSAAVMEFTKAKDGLAKAYEAHAKTLTIEKNLDAARSAKAEWDQVARTTNTTDTDSPHASRKPRLENKPMPRGVQVMAWAEARDLDGEILLVPRKTVVKATSSHPGNWGPENAIDGDSATEFAFLGTKGDLVLQFDDGVECSGLLLRSRRHENDACTNGFVRIDGATPVPIAKFGGGRVVVISLGRKQRVRNVLFHCEQGTHNPGISEVFLIR